MGCFLHKSPKFLVMHEHSQQKWLEKKQSICLTDFYTGKGGDIVLFIILVPKVLVMFEHPQQKCLENKKQSIRLIDFYTGIGKWMTNKSSPKCKTKNYNLKSKIICCFSKF